MSKKNKNQKTFVLFDSFIQAAKEYSPSIFRQAVLKYMNYALYGDDTPSESNEVNMLMTLVKESIDNTKKRYEQCVKNGSKGKEHGWKGGRHRKTPKITPKETPKKPQEEPLNKPLYVDVGEDVGKYEEEDRYVYADEDTYAAGNADVYADRDDYADVDSYATGNEDEYEDWDEEEDDYAEEEVDDPEEEDDYWDEETYPTSDTTSRNYYKESSISTTTYPVSQQCKDTMREKIKPTFSYEKPILPTSDEGLQQEYRKNLSILLQYDLNHQDYDDTSRESLRRATDALMKWKHLSFQQARDCITNERRSQRMRM